MEKVQQNLLFIRKKNKLSQAAFGELFGLTRGQIDTYERGKSSISIADAIKICEHFGVPAEDFFKADLAAEHYKAGSRTAGAKTDNETIAELRQDKEDLRKANMYAEQLIEMLKEEIKDLQEQLNDHKKDKLSDKGY